MKQDRLLDICKHTRLQPRVAKTGTELLKMLEDGDPFIVVSQDKFDKAMRNRKAKELNLDDDNLFILGEVNQ